MRPARSNDDWGCPNFSFFHTWKMLLSVNYRGIEKADETLKTRGPDLLPQARRSGGWRRVLRVAPAQQVGDAADGLPPNR